MTESGPDTAFWRGRTLWRHGASAPLRSFLRTESGSAGVLVTAVLVALVWANVDASSYASFWHTEFEIRLGSAGMSYDLREWVNSGLMTFFFLVVGLESRREFDLGDLRERRRFLLPLAVGLVAMVIPVLIYVAFNAGRSTAHGWGIAMSTDTALALGVLSLLGRRVPDRVRIFLVTVFVVDDLAALVVIALVYSDEIVLLPLLVAIALFGFLLLAVRLKMQQRWLFLMLVLLIWGALMASGVDPLVAGLAIGLAAPAYPPNRNDLEDATGLVREFREQPTAALARSATASLTSTLSPNARLQTFYHPWTSYVIVPLFALSNAGIELDPSFLGHAYTTPVTLGVLIGYVVGKPIAVVATSWAVCVLSRGRVRPPVGWAAVLGSGTIAGIGFTVALLIATRAFEGEHLAEAKLGALSAVLVASLLTFAVVRVIGLFPPERRARLLLGDASLIQDLVPEVDVERDHIRGPKDAVITLIEFGDFQCPYCGQAEPVVRDLLNDGEIRYVWRHLPLTDVHPRAQVTAEAAEAAGSQGAFWEMHDLLLSHQDELRPADLMRYAEQVGIDPERFHDEIREGVHQTRVAQDVESADVSGVSGTPTFFINGQRHYGAFDLETLSAAIKTARAQARIR
jgi:Na+/H+ antiporter NhaA